MGPNPKKLEIEGKVGFAWLAVVIAAVFIDPKVIPSIEGTIIDLHHFGVPFGIREVIMGLVGFLAFRTADKAILTGNDFNFEPIKEVGFLFIGIFLTMQPALTLIGAFAAENADSLGVTSFYFGTGILSGVLDNAPTYVSFLSAAMGKFGSDVNVPEMVTVRDGNTLPAETFYLQAISVAAVFWGALTYIGNGPNFMVKAIAESSGVDTPSFVAYMVKYSIPILVPIYILVWFVFFSGYVVPHPPDAARTPSRPSSSPRAFSSPSRSDARPHPFDRRSDRRVPPEGWSVEDEEETLDRPRLRVRRLPDGVRIPDARRLRGRGDGPPPRDHERLQPRRAGALDARRGQPRDRDRPRPRPPHQRPLRPPSLIAQSPGLTPMYDSFVADLVSTGPILMVAALGVLVVVLDAFRNDDASIPWVAGIGMTVAAVLQAFAIGDPGTAFDGQVYVGGPAAVANIIILIGAVASVVLTVPYLSRLGRNYGEVHALILFATAGMMTLASAGSLVTLFVGLETMSVCLYVLTGLVREESTANESALKYFLLGAFSTGFFLYGLALLYGATGTMDLAGLAPGVAETGRTGLFLAGVGLLLVGFFFKVSAVPFHMWTPDVYQGAPTALTAFMSTASKAAVFAALAVVLSRALPAEFVDGTVQTVLAIVAAVTMVGGNVVALVQTNVKRMLAYSSVAHAGYILAGLAAGTDAGYGASLFYLLAYTLMNLGAFGVMGALEWDAEQGADQDLDSLAGVGYRKPFLGVAMGVFMFALTGFPPLAGFIGKYLVFAAAVDAGLVWLAVLGVLASVVSGYYYMRVLVVIWMRAPTRRPTTPSSRSRSAPGRWP